MTDDRDDLRALAPVFLILAGLVIAALLWCMLSSCLGTPCRRALSSLWEYAVLSSQTSGGRAPRHRRGFGEQEVWEMETRGRAG
ncbi:hypothetical protein FPV67DRAFT_99687 [Lyophyllum atratum]|nr:hypothetical protein FPV67DRAFT_99687 [Lyophyllum atratum]